MSFAALAISTISSFGQSITRSADGSVIIQPVPMDEAFKNAVSPEYEALFWSRANKMLRAMTKKPDGSWRGTGNNTFFENEKRSYPGAMLWVVAGNEKAGLAILQGEDEQAKGDNKHTLGIDLFPAFTLKGQMRKYFFFGAMLDPSYRDRMKQAFAIWTKTDPRTTPHPIHQKFNPKVEGWGPNRFGNRQVDTRNTDNLRAMRDIAIYLFAEEAGNIQTKDAAKRDIISYVNTLYSIGMGEWDSDTYHSHTIAPYLCLYDFSKDPDMKAVAKAALDHLFTSAALKYFNATFAGPSKRDYGVSYKPYGQSFNKFFPLYFGQAEHLEKAEDLELPHAITSNYRPPKAVIALANREFARPLEILGSKPVYENAAPAARQRPGYFETLYFGQTFQMGSCISPTGDGDTGPFRLVAANSVREADVVIFNSRPKFNEKFPGDQIGQSGNLLIWLRPTDKTNPFAFFLPKDAKVEVREGIWFVPMEKTWLALRPINLSAMAPMKMETKAAEDHAKRYPDTVVMTAAAGEGAYSGFAMEVGELPQTFDAFKDSVLAKGKLELADLSSGKVRLTGSDGKFVEMLHNASSDLPTLNRNGVTRDWNDPENWKLWQTVGPQSVVSLGWKVGTLRVVAGGHEFESTMLENGNASFTNK